MKKDNKAKITLALIVAKLIILLCKIIKKGGTATPGRIALKISPNLLNSISDGMNTILVTGTNGKTTTTRMLSTILDSENIPYISNREGANIEIGITTTFIKNATLSGKPKTNYSVIECDELYIPRMVKRLNPVAVIMTTLSEDQTDRLGGPLKVSDLFIETLKDSNAIICTNKDCEYTARVAEDVESKKVMFFSAKDMTCIVNGEEIPADLKLKAPYNFYNAAAALTGAKVFGLDYKKAVNALNKMPMPYGRFEELEVNGNNVSLVLVKNPDGANKVLEYLSTFNQKRKIVFGVNAKPEDGTDASWINGVDIEGNNELIDTVTVYGEKSSDLQERFKKAGFDSNVASQAKDVVDQIEQGNTPVLLLLNYTCMMEVRSELARRNYVENFWED